MLAIVGIGRGDAREHVLIALTRQQITVFQRLLADIRQQRITRPVDLDAFHHAQMRLGVRLGLAARRATRVGNLRFHLAIGGRIQWRHDGIYSPSRGESVLLRGRRHRAAIEPKGLRNSV